jgi:nucleotide-binding universal stress UspA family protein
LGQWTVGVDGSKGADQALQWAEANAPTRATGIRLVSVVGGNDERAAEVTPEAKPHAAHRDLGQPTDRLAPHNISVESVVQYGEPAEALLAASRDTDLLLLGRRGLGGFRRLLLGSVSHHCATHARLPVVVIPAESRTDGQLNEIAVGFDGSPAAGAALRWALEFAPDTTIVRVICAGWRTGVDPAIVDESTGKSQLDLRAAVDRSAEAANPNATVECVFVDGYPRDALSDASTTADLVVVGERGHRGLSAVLLGSVTTEVLHRSTCPVVVIPTPPTENAPPAR